MTTITISIAIITLAFATLGAVEYLHCNVHAGYDLLIKKVFKDWDKMSQVNLRDFNKLSFKVETVVGEDGKAAKTEFGCPLTDEEIQHLKGLFEYVYTRPEFEGTIFKGRYAEPILDDQEWLDTIYKLIDDFIKPTVRERNRKFRKVIRNYELACILHSYLNYKFNKIGVFERPKTAKKYGVKPLN